MYYDYILWLYIIIMLKYVLCLYIMIIYYHYTKNMLFIGIRNQFFFKLCTYKCVATYIHTYSNTWCICTYIHIYSYIHTSTCAFILSLKLHHQFIQSILGRCIHTHMQIYIYTWCMLNHMLPYTQSIKCTYTVTYIHLHVHALSLLSAHTQLHTYIYMCMHTQSQVHIYSYIHTYIYMCMHTQSTAPSSSAEIHLHTYIYCTSQNNWRQLSWLQRFSSSKLVLETVDSGQRSSIIMGFAEHAHAYSVSSAYIHLYTYIHLHVHAYSIHSTIVQCICFHEFDFL